nr:hypothetical protein [uncultured bacterium]AQQ74869.1 hypothetical protein [uncultured bacterium]
MRCALFRRYTIRLIAFAVVSAAPAMTFAAEPGELAFKNRCRTCHSVREGDNRMGPSLHGIVGAQAGSSQGAAYSQALKSSDIVWDEEKLDAFIENPDAVVPGNNMKPYGGLPNPEERKQIIRYLKSAAEQKT